MPADLAAGLPQPYCCAVHRFPLFALFLLPSVMSSQAIAPYRDARVPTDERVRDLLGRMSREEKFSQLFMLPDDLRDPSHDFSHGVFGLQIDAPPAASAHAERINAIQRFFVERTRLGIPIIPFDEAVHG